MTTAVTVLISGNKACTVDVIDVEGKSIPHSHKEIKPQEFCVVSIHGEQTVSVKEIGNFIT